MGNVTQTAEAKRKSGPKGTRKSTLARMEKARELKIKGATTGEIAKALGVTRQRVLQMLRGPREVFNFVRGRAKSRCQQCSFELSNGNVYSPSGDYGDLARLEYLCDEHFALRYRERER